MNGTPLTDTEAERIAMIFSRVLQQARSVSDSEHYDHHRWITAKIEAEQEKRKFWQEMRRHVTKWGLIGALTGLASALYLAAEAWVRHVK